MGLPNQANTLRRKSKQEKKSCGSFFFASCAFTQENRWVQPGFPLLHGCLLKGDFSHLSRFEIQNFFPHRCSLINVSHLFHAFPGLL